MRIKFLKILSITSIISLPVLSTAVSCSENYSSETKQIDGSDWTGHEYGLFSENDYIINHKEKSVTYTNGVKYIGDNLVIPDYVIVNDKQYKVLLAAKCFKENHLLTGSLTFNIHTTSIPDECFYQCDQIRTISFKNYITSFGKGCFYSCMVLLHITSNPIYLSKVAVYDDYCFFRTSLDINFSFGSELKHIGAHAFSLTSGLGYLDLSHTNSLTRISDYAFFGCTGLYKLILPRSLSYIGKHAFQRCKNLTDITLPESDMHFAVDEWAFYGDEDFTGFSRTCSFTYLGPNAFGNCLSFNIDSKIALSNPNLTEINEFAFSDCYNSYIYIPKNISVVRRYAFWHNTGPAGSLETIDVSEYVDHYPIFCGTHVFNGEHGIVYINKNSQIDRWKEVLSNKGISFESGAWSFQIKR